MREVRLGEVLVGAVASIGSEPSTRTHPRVKVELITTRQVLGDDVVNRHVGRAQVRQGEPTGVAGQTEAPAAAAGLALATVGSLSNP